MMIKDYIYNNTDEEYARIKEFLMRVQVISGYDNNWDVGRLNWWRYNVHSQKEVDFFRENAHYWADERGTVTGLFISEYGRNDFFAMAAPGYPGLLEEIITWGERSWGKEKEEISTSIFTDDVKKAGMLKKLGYGDEQHESNVRYYDLTDYNFTYDLKPGYRIISFNEFGSYEQRLNTVRNAFNVANYPKERLVALQSSPQYIPELDLLVAAPDGRCAAYCMGWIEEYDASRGYIEPMGTHSDFRRMGFASALAKECFKRLHALGVATAAIASDAEPNISNFLYESLKPSYIKRAYEFKKTL